MANSIDLIIGQEAIKQIENLISKLSLADAELIKISQSASVAGKGINGISTPSGLDKSIGSTASLNAELEKQNAIIDSLTKKIDALAKKRENDNTSAKNTLRALEQETKSRQALQTQKDRAIAQANKEQVVAEKNANTYNKTQAQINRLTTAYNDLSVRKARYNNLNENEEKRLGTLSAINEKYNGILKQTDATIGKNQRNVGNYASGYNALGNSINQLTREAPAFANSVNTGFMAISNNIPALFDAIKGIRVQNQALASEGKPTVSVLKSLAGALFSWGTLLSVGVTLLTLYGGELIKWASNAMKGKEAINSIKISQDGLNKAFEESSVKDAVKNVNELTTNIDLAKKGIISKESVVNQYNETIGKTTGLVTSLDEAEKELTKNGDAYVKMTLYKAAANLALEEAAKATLKAEQDRLKKSEEFKSTTEDIFSVIGRGAGGGQGVDIEKENKAREKRNIARKNAMIKESEDLAKTQEDIAKNFQQKAASISSKMGFNLLGDNKTDTTDKKEEVKRDIAEFQNNLKTIDILANNINSEIERLKVEKIVANAEELPSINFQLEQLLTLKKQLNKIPTAEFKINTPIEPKDIEKVKEMTEAMKGYLNSFSAEFMANSGFSETFKMLNHEIEGLGENFAVTFNAIAESAQEAFNFISNSSQQNFDAEYSRLENQKETALKFAGDSTTAKAKIEADYEKKKKEIANRENKAKQKQAIFNIAIDTAQAIMAAVAKSPLTGGLPFSAIAAGIGAIQIGMVASQKIPQYFDGGTHGGGLAMINDAGGSNYVETVVTPDGKVSQYSGRDVVTNLPAGTEIFTPEQWRDKELQYMLNSKGISMQKNATNNGMTAQEMDIVLSKHFSKIQTNTTIFDKNGIRTWSESNGNKTIQNANRVSRTGLKV
jgi:hypothetical protein